MRFYRINGEDEAAGNPGLSLLLPGGVSFRYPENSGRRIVKTIIPFWGSISSVNLDVPYLDQLDIPNIGNAACASASAAMVLAYHGKIQGNKHAMIEAAENMFSATSSTALGLLARDNFVNYMEGTHGFSTVYFDDSYWPDLFSLIQNEIRSGRPMVIGSRSMTSAGHYMVVTGYDGNSYGNAQLIINDPYGQWRGYNSYSTSASGEGVRYDYTDITSQPSDGVFVIFP